MLEALFVRNSKVTPDGVRTALNLLKNLKYLDHQQPLPTVENIDNNVQLPHGSLKSLRCTGYGNVTLECTIPLADNVLSSIYVTDDYVEDMDLIRSYDVKNNFHEGPHLVFDRAYFLRFDRGIASYLSRFGTSLQSLELESFPEVDVSIILRYCPLLKQLKLFQNIDYTSFIPTAHTPSLSAPPAYNPIILPSISVIHLENFEFIARSTLRESGDCPELLTILMSPNLKRIKIENCFYLVDQIIIDAFNFHRFQKLESLTLNNCNQLNKKAFSDVFLSQSNSLKTLRLLCCDKLCTESNRNEWMLLAEKQNWDFNMEIVMQP